MNINDIFDIIKNYINISVRWERLLQEISDEEREKVTCSSQSRIAKLNSQRKLSEDLKNKAIKHEKNRQDKLRVLPSVENEVDIGHHKYIYAISTLNYEDLNSLYKLIDDEILLINKTLNSLSTERTKLYNKAASYEHKMQYVEADELKAQIEEKFRQYTFLSRCISFYKSIGLDIKDRIINYNSDYSSRTY